MRLLIANGYVIDPTQGINGGQNLLIEDGRVAALLSRGAAVPEGAEEFDARSLIVSLGFIDLHRQLRESRQEYKETILTGTSAAVVGGYTSLSASINSET